MAGSCSEHQQQPADPIAKAKAPSTAPQHQVPSPASTTVYGDPSEATFEILRLPPHAFSQLPETIISILRARACTIPQPYGSRPPQNVIHGDFFGDAKTGWAVLCSSGGFSSILVFRDDLDENPEELARREDEGYLQHIGDGKIGYSRGIYAVDRNFIMRQYRAHGGPEPPNIDHQGIEDAFLEKASGVHYRYEGKWLQLVGAD